MVYEHRYNEIIDRMIAEERRESIALQKIIFPTVALFVSTLVVGIFKPQIFANSAIIGKIILISLFVAGVIHLFGRIRDALDKYTYNPDDLMIRSLTTMSRSSNRIRGCRGGVSGCRISASFSVGLLIGNYVDFVSDHLCRQCSLTSLNPEFVFYPPIFVLFVDLMHGLHIEWTDEV